MLFRSRLSLRGKLGALTGVFQRMVRQLDPVRRDRGETPRLHARVERQPAGLELRPQTRPRDARARRIHGAHDPPHAASGVKLAMRAESAVFAAVGILDWRAGALPQLPSHGNRFLRGFVRDREHFLQPDQLSRVRDGYVGMTHFVDRALERALSANELWAKNVRLFVRHTATGFFSKQIAYAVPRTPGTRGTDRADTARRERARRHRHDTDPQRDEHQRQRIEWRDADEQAAQNSTGRIHTRHSDEYPDQ